MQKNKKFQQRIVEKWKKKNSNINKGNSVNHNVKGEKNKTFFCR